MQMQEQFLSCISAEVRPTRYWEDDHLQTLFNSLKNKSFLHFKSVSFASLSQDTILVFCIWTEESIYLGIYDNCIMGLRDILVIT